MTRYKRPPASRLQQGLVLRNVDIPEVHAKRKNAARAKRKNAARASFTTFRWLIILNQACDLDLDHHARHGTSPVAGGQPVRMDKALRTVLLCPGFPADDVLNGTYLQPVTHAAEFRGTEQRMVLSNRHERFHVLEPEEPLLTDRLILDFKLIVAVAPDYLERWVRNNAASRLAVLMPPYRDRLTQRFTNYFNRIAEPDEA